MLVMFKKIIAITSALGVGALVAYSGYFWIGDGYYAHRGDRLISLAVIVLSSLSLPVTAVGYVRAKNQEGDN